MDHVAGLPSPASTRMSPGALTLAVLLHVAAALALWWMTVNRPALAPVEEAIDITIEKPKPLDPPPPPEPKPQPKPQPPPQAAPKPTPKPTPPLVVDGLRPFAETAEKRSQVRPSGEAAKDIAGPPPPSLEDQIPKPTSPPPPQIETAMKEEPAPPVPTPPPQQQPVPKPEAGPTVAPSLPPPAPKAVQPQPHPTTAPSVTPPTQARPAPPPSVLPTPQPRPTPQISRPQDRPAAIARREEPPSSSPLVNPADRYNRNLAGDNYLIGFNQKLRTYRFDSKGVDAHATVRVVVSRDGRLLDAEVVRSSGYPVIDSAIITALRVSSPYPPLPPELGERASFVLPIGSIPAGPRF